MGGERTVDKSMAKPDVDPARAAPTLVMIDSNVFDSDLRFRSPDWVYLDAYLKKTNARLLIPDIVQREIERKLKETLDANVRDAGKLASELAAYGIMLAGLGEETRALWPRDARRAFRRRLKLLGATSAAVPNVPHSEVLDRLFAEKKPFNRTGDKGYRDYLIWKSLLAACEPSTRAALITQNTNDFALNGDLHPDLVDDAEAADIRVELHPSLRAFVENVVLTTLPSSEHAMLLLDNPKSVSAIDTYISCRLDLYDLGDALDLDAVQERVAEDFAAQYWLPAVPTDFQVNGASVERLKNIVWDGEISCVEVEAHEVMLEFDAELEFVAEVECYGRGVAGTVETSLSQALRLAVALTVSTNSIKPHGEITIVTNAA